MPEIDVEQVMRRVRLEARGAGPPSSHSPSWTGWDPRAILEPGATCHVKDFLMHHDADFVRSAYLGILGREPEPPGYLRFLSKLRDGSRSKVEILGRMRYSREGRKRNVRVLGLALPYLLRLLYGVPILGYAVQLCVVILRLPWVIRELQRVEASLHARFTETAGRLDDILFKTHDHLTRLESRIGDLPESHWVQKLRQELEAASRR